MIGSGRSTKFSELRFWLLFGSKSIFSWCRVSSAFYVTFFDTRFELNSFLRKSMSSWQTSRPRTCFAKSIALFSSFSRSAYSLASCISFSNASSGESFYSSWLDGDVIGDLSLASLPSPGSAILVRFWGPLGGWPPGLPLVLTALRGLIFNADAAAPSAYPSSS